MSSEFGEKYTHRYLMMHRFLFAFFIFFILLLVISGVNRSVFNILYFILLGLASILVDEYIFRKNLAISSKIYEIKAFIQLALFSCGFFKRTDCLLLYVIVFSVQMLLYFEYIVFNDIFYETQLMNKRLTGMIPIMIGLIAYNWGNFSTEWIIMFFVAAVTLFAIMLIISDYYAKSLLEYNYKYTSLYFTTEKLEEDKNELLEYQHKVKTVNNELNLQRVNLAKLNTELENSANEMHALIDVMKEISSTFDIKNSMGVLVSTVFDVKNVDVVSFYIDKGIFKNKEAAICTKSAGDEDVEFFENIMTDMYDILKDAGMLQPVVLAGPSVMRHEYFESKPYTDVVIFPAYENEDIYGVLLCASKKVNFFYNGYAFYESALIDFSSVLKSTKLYLQMEDMANIDSLTGLNNRLNFNKTFPVICKEAVNSNQPLSVAMIDVDHFKDVNDTYGHLAGDKILREVGAILLEYAKKYKGIAVRYGGEEFLMILPGKREEESYKALTEVHDKIMNNAIDHSGKIIRINTSIGLSIYPDTCDDINKIVDSADETMYYSKNHGRGMLLVAGKEIEYASKYLNLRGEA